MTNKLAMAIAGTERNIEILQVLMAMMVDGISPESDEDAISDLAHELIDAAEDLHNGDWIIKIPFEDEDGQRKKLCVKFGVYVEEIPDD